MATAPRAKMTVVIAGGGFGGIYTAWHLEKLTARRRDIEIVLVSRDNFFLMTPLLFEAFSGTLEFRHCSVPLREFLRRTRFVEATVTGVDLDERIVRAVAVEGGPYEIRYDQLVLSLGSRTNHEQIPGSEAALTFKTLADAMILRNHVIERFERADAERDPEHKRCLLTFAIIGGGLVGVELLGEMTAFVDEIVRYYPRVRREEVRFILCQYGDRILPEIRPHLAAYAEKVLESRTGVDIRTDTPVTAIGPDKVHLNGQTIKADTIVLAAGIVPNPLIAELPLEKDRRGRVSVEATMRSRSHPEVWALGDCASIPGPDGNPYPSLAQHALREARQLAYNLVATADGRPAAPFMFKTLGTTASLGHHNAIAEVLGVPLRGFVAWWARRTYYLLKMPQWSRRLRIVIDWTFALLFRPDIVKLDLASEATTVARPGAAGTHGEAAGAGGAVAASAQRGAAGPVPAPWEREASQRAAARSERDHAPEAPTAAERAEPSGEERPYPRTGSPG